MCLSLWELYSWAPVSWWVLCCWWCMFHALIFPIYGRDTSLICRKKTFSPVILSPAKYHCKRVGMFILCWLQMSLFWCNYRAGIFLSRVQKGHMCISVTINVHAQAFFLIYWASPTVHFITTMNMHVVSTTEKLLLCLVSFSHWWFCLYCFIDLDTLCYVSVALLIPLNLHALFASEDFPSIFVNNTNSSICYLNLTL